MIIYVTKLILWMHDNTSYINAWKCHGFSGFLQKQNNTRQNTVKTTQQHKKQYKHKSKHKK